MSNARDSLDPERIVNAHDQLTEPAAIRRMVAILSSSLRFTAFWTAVALPFLYVPLLFGGLNGSEQSVFLTLVGLNVIALVLGHSYGGDDTTHVRA